MRLIGEFDLEKEAFDFSCLLKQEKISSNFDSFTDTSTGQIKYRIWVVEEDQVERAFDMYLKFKEDPSAKIFTISSEEMTLDQEVHELKVEEKGKALKVSVKKIMTPWTYFLTYLFLLVCTALFLVDSSQRDSIEKKYGRAGEQILLTPLQKHLMIDYTQSMQAIETIAHQFPKDTSLNFSNLSPYLQTQLQAAESMPSWRGFYSFLLDKGKTKEVKGSFSYLFEKERQGQLWRLFTPCLLHSDFLHIIFNMAWLWVLGKQIEERLSKRKMFLMIVIVAIAANVAQYLMSGPYFLGFSGVVVGMTGFIWSRQKKAPWEGYPLQKATAFFILLFVIAMFALEVVSYGLHYFAISQVMPNVANTAHVAGGLTGLLIGRIKFFGRGEY